MFGHQNNDQDQSNNGYGQVNDTQPTNPPAPAPLNFNPALPTPPPQDSPAAPATDTNTTSEEPVTSAPPVDMLVANDATNDLLDIKQRALNELSPLVEHLEQSPEEKFRTTMMMIQATDNQALVKDAYAAAQAIPDEKIKAQALLDIVNEINYFTQHHQA
ncbi:hypothetical protein H7Y63_00310 [Polaromonas sp.]|nr:hypothetical protein [Candidatus Saccharibacteria bacterium]